MYYAFESKCSIQECGRGLKKRPEVLKGSGCSECQSCSPTAPKTALESEMGKISIIFCLW